MNLFFNELVTPPSSLPVEVDAADRALAAGVVEELERVFLWRAIVRQKRRVIIDGPLPPVLELEPVAAIVSLTRWTPSDPAAVIDADTYYLVSRDPRGAFISPANGLAWPEPERAIGSFVLTYSCGFLVTPETSSGAGDAVNEVPPSLRHMVGLAVEFRSGSGLGDLAIGSLRIDRADSYATDALPPEIVNIGRAYQYRAGLFVGRP